MFLNSHFKGGSLGSILETMWQASRDCTQDTHCGLTKVFLLSVWRFEYVWDAVICSLKDQLDYEHALI